MTVADSDGRPLLPTGIAGPNRSGGIIQDPTPETIEIWRSVFDVNVLGSINILKAFVPGLVEAGPLRSGKRTVVVTTSSSLGLYNMMPGPCQPQHALAESRVQVFQPVTGYLCAQTTRPSWR